jgi:hypothetical protein
MILNSYNTTTETPGMPFVSNIPNRDYFLLLLRIEFQTSDTTVQYSTN